MRYHDQRKRLSAANRLFLLGVYDEVDHPRSRHRWGVDRVSLCKLFSAAGFAEFAARPFLDSRIRVLEAVKTRPRGLQVEGGK